MNAPIHVALLTEFPRELGCPVGGVEAVARNLVLGLGQQHDLHADVVCVRRDVQRFTSVQLSARAAVHYLPQLGRLELPTLFLHDRIVISKVLRQLRPDVLHAHDAGRYPYTCGALGYQYVLTVHGFVSREEQISPRRRLGARFRRALLRHVEAVAIDRAAVIVANSSYVLRQVPPSHHERATLIPNPVDPFFFTRDTTPACPGRIVWVGIIRPLKGLDLLLHALATVCQVIPSAHVQLVGPCGDPRYLAELEHLTLRLGLEDRVTLLGPKHGMALRSEYASAAVVVLPSRQENVPMCIAEAMAMGRAVVATDVGGVSDLVVDGATGLLCAPGDSAALSRALIDVLSDESRRDAMGATAEARARVLFNSDAIAAQHRSVYGFVKDAAAPARCPC